MQPEDEIPDYMSSEILLLAAESDKTHFKAKFHKQSYKTPQSQLLHSINPKDTLQEHSIYIPSSKKLKSEMFERLESGLESAIPPTNIGYKLLCKLGGFKEGSGLGKFGKGVINPLLVDLHQSKQGIGKFTEKKEKEMKKYLIVQKYNKEFENNKRNEYNFKKLSGKLKSIIRITNILDSEAELINNKILEEVYIEIDHIFGETGIFDNILRGLITSKNKCKENYEDEEEIRLAGGKRLFHQMKYTIHYQEAITFLEAKYQKINLYLRQEHFYCVFCGAKYQDEENLNKLCPGATDDLH